MPDSPNPPNNAPSPGTPPVAAPAGGGGSTVATTPVSSVPVEALDRLVAEIKGLAPRPAPVEDPAVANQRDYDARLAAAREKYKTLHADGRYDEALDAVLAVVTAPPAVAPAVDNNPWFVAASEASLDRAERRHADIFKAYGGEVQAELSKLPPADRITSKGIDAAVAVVRGRHLDEIIEARVAAGIEERYNTVINTPSNVPSRALGEDASTELHGLTRADREQAVRFGLDYKTYAAAQAALNTGVDFEGQGIEIPGA